jgi:uncharacterized SAM-binding protein YcdF (DUF218 family)
VLAASTFSFAALWLVAALELDRHGTSTRAPDGEWDAIVVPGCRGTTRALFERVELASELFHEGIAPRIVFTGGRGSADISEAEAAAFIAGGHGVPASAIVLEASSTSTEENAAFAAAAIDAERVVVVTDAYHVWRAERVFARHFAHVHAIGSQNPDGAARTIGALREVPAIIVYALRGRL